MLKKTVFLTCTLILFLSCVRVSFYFIKPVRAATTWTVDDDGPADFHTIGEAIEAGSDGDTISVASGIYGPIRDIIRKSLTLQGEGAGNTIIKDGIWIQANNLKIDGFTIGALQYDRPPIVSFVAGGENCTLSNSIILNLGEENLHYDWPSVAIGGSGWLISGNIIQDLYYGAAIGMSLAGLGIWGNGNKVIGNTIGNETLHGGRKRV